MANKWMQYFPVKWFWRRLMVAAKSINNIPDEYLSYARNARIYDWGIWPRKGKEILTNSVLWTNNKGWFTMWGNLYQIANSKIYLVDQTTWVQTEKATLGYDAMTDILVYNNVALIVSPQQPMKVFNGYSATTVATVPIRTLWTATVTIASPAVITLANHWLKAGDYVYLTTI